jgi:thioesterase domain-containing protein
LKAQTIRKLAELIRNEELGQDFTPVIPINTVGEHTPLFFIPGKGGYPTRIRHLAKKIDPQTPVYALQDLSIYRNTKIIHSIESTAFFYLNEIKNIYPHGPYILVGESLGGKIAYEMAQQLLKSSEKVPVLIMLDTDILWEHIIEFYRSKHNIPFYTMLIKKHLSILVRSDWQGKLDYFRFYRETIGQKAKRFLGRRLSRLKKPSSPALPENVSQIERANLEADLVYQVQSYPGRVILVKAMRGPKADNPTNGWDRVKLGELVIHPLDCYHGSILFDPAVSQLALILQRYIEENIRENA